MASQQILPASPSESMELPETFPSNEETTSIRIESISTKEKLQNEDSPVEKKRVKKYTSVSFADRFSNTKELRKALDEKRLKPKTKFRKLLKKGLNSISAHQ